MVKTKEELRKSQYDNPEVKLAWREANLRRYAENPQLRYSITRKAHEAVIKKSLEKFKANPTKKISKRGYMMIYIPQKGWKKEHHYIWENYNDPVHNGFILHHINHNKLDNRIENLQLMTISEHHSYHTTLINNQNKEKNRERALNRDRNNKGQFLPKNR